jgi:hypothetical protein
MGLAVPRLFRLRQSRKIKRIETVTFALPQANQASEWF